MDPGSGRLYPTFDAALADGVEFPVMLTGTTEAIEQISRAVSAQYRAQRKTKNKAARRSRRANRKG